MPNPQIYESAVLEAAAGKIINKRLLHWVEEVAVLCKPDRVHICDGSEAEYQLMMRIMVQSGTAVALNTQIAFTSGPHRMM
jgi:GTP-dependent phosphoenolpyruvate carboxykinase